MINPSDAKDMYRQAMVNFFLYLGTQPITFFTDAQTLPFIQQIAGPNVDIQVRDVDHLPIYNDIPVAEWKAHLEMDTEKYHTWQLGAIWASKAYFVKEAAELDPSESWFVWVDAGCIRTPLWEPFLQDFTQREFLTQTPGVYIQSLIPLPKEPMLVEFHPTTKYVAGGIILFHRDYIQPYLKEYVRVFKLYTDAKKPAICDQFVIATLAQKNDWVYPIRPRIRTIPDTWFFFLAVL